MIILSWNKRSKGFCYTLTDIPVGLASVQYVSQYVERYGPLGVSARFPLI